jgi:hypothetical protein
LQIPKLWYGLVVLTLEDERRCVIEAIRDFLEGAGGVWDWDDFISVSCTYPEFEAVRRICLSLPANYPPADKRHYCSEAGLEVLRHKLAELTAGDP